MKKIRSLLIIAACLCFTSCVSDMHEIASDLLSIAGDHSGSGKTKQVPAYTNDEAVSAMKDALEEGIKFASTQLSQKDAYFKNAAIKILLPPEAEPILNVLTKLPKGQNLVDDVVLRLNRTAEEAAKDTVSIFVKAIKGMTVIDGIKIVTGSKNAATQYLKDKCYDELVALYSPKINTVLDKPLVMNVSANQAWTTLVTTYNKYGEYPNQIARLARQKEPCPKVEVNLAKYATQKALDGLFLKIEEEEAKIRENPLKYASQMIQKVFNYVKLGITTITVRA